ncbi:MAG: B12-binding domain-containing radical SAM protein [Nitrospinota bacterium]|nr:B12-binding domain-containing radical SAM protein [Nitrospinota bacterium]
MSSTRVLLVAPAGDLAHILTPDLGIGFVASALRHAGYQVDFIDIKRDRISNEKLAETIRKNDYLMVGVKAFSPFLPEVNMVIDTIKEASPGIKVILGGPHPTYAWDKALKSCPNADIGIIGEGEIPVVKIADAIRAGKGFEGIESISYKDGDEIKASRPSGNFQSLENLPIPAWDLMDPRLYLDYENFWYFSKGETVANISISRGCPFSCAFCSDFMNYGKKVRYRNMKHVIEEIQRLQEYYGVDELHITDSIFTVNRKYAYEFCETLIRKRIKIHWATIDGTRLDTLDAPLLRAMEESGCYGTSVGIESGSERILEFMKKGITKEKIEEKVHLIKDTTNFLVQGYFILGYPTETLETMNETIDFAVKLPLDMAAFSPFRLTPGTEIAHYLEQHEPESAPDWSGQTMERIRYFPKGVTPEEMKAIHKKAYRAFYFRPHMVWKYLKFAKGKKQFKILASKMKKRIFG